MSPNNHNATDAALGYYYQGMYALSLLLNANDDACVSIETADDVTLEDGMTHLHQLKHSLCPTSPLTISTDAFWKTLKVWSDNSRSPNERLILATCATIGVDCPLQELTSKEVPRSKQVIDFVSNEAIRVRIARDKAKKAGQPLPYEKRAPGCEAWLALENDSQQMFLDRVLLVPSIPNAADIPNTISTQLRSAVRPEVRSQLVERLLEWWDRQVVLSMLRKRDRRLSKLELQSQIGNLIIEHSEFSLPVDFARLKPEDLKAEMTGVMVEQIELVDGGESRTTRAAIARWRVRVQREKWLNDNFAIATELDAFDSLLVERWQDRHGPMQDDCKGRCEEECSRRGRELLDWSHLTAHTESISIRPMFSHEFLVQGTYQQLSDEKRVGWHPNYLALLRLGRKEA